MQGKCGILQIPDKNLALQLVCEGGLPWAPLLSSDSRQPGLARLTLMQEGVLRCSSRPLRWIPWVSSVFPETRTGTRPDQDTTPVTSESWCVCGGNYDPLSFSVVFVPPGDPVETTVFPY